MYSNIPDPIDAHIYTKDQLKSVYLLLENTLERNLKKHKKLYLVTAQVLETWSG